MISLPLLLDTLGNMCIAIVCLEGYDVIDFEINRIFLGRIHCEIFLSEYFRKY